MGIRAVLLITDFQLPSANIPQERGFDDPQSSAHTTLLLHNATSCPFESRAIRCWQYAVEVFPWAFEIVFETKLPVTRLSQTLA